jgi:nucleotide-binding universal stress UspA family protein
MAPANPHMHAARFPSAVSNVLVIASALQDARATALALEKMKARESIRIHILAVESPPSGYARHFLRGIDLRALQEAEGLKTLAALRAELDALGIACNFHVEIGPWLATIARFAREISCARVVVGENPGHPLANLLLRHDCWRIGSFLRRSGQDCPVVRREEPTLTARAPLPRRASRPH